MDFARKQLEKYGWQSGRGLGKQENGITEAIKPKLKRSVAGIGHDAAAEFTEHWWKLLYDKAAQNVEIQEENGVPKKFKAKEAFEITNSTWKLGRKSKGHQGKDLEYFENFVKKAVLTSGGTKLEAMSSESESDDDTKVKKDVLNMTDEELFAACGGRTAHKGARHGLKAVGKLARIEEQERKLLADTKFDGYHKSTNHKSKSPQMEELSLESNSEESFKKKYCQKTDNDLNDYLYTNASDTNTNSKSKKHKIKNQESDPKKSKESKRIDKNLISDGNDIEDGTKTDDIELRTESNDIDYNEIEKLISKKKKRHVESEDNSLNQLNNEIEIPKAKKKKTKSKCSVDL